MSGLTNHQKAKALMTVSLQGRGFRRAVPINKNCHPECRPNERSERGPAKDLLDAGNQQGRSGWERKVPRLALTRPLRRARLRCARDDNSKWVTAVFLFAVLVLAPSAFSQDWIRTGTGLGVEKVRLAVPDFKVATTDASNAPLQQTFDEVLWGDLANAGIFDMVSKSFYPLQTPGTPQELNITAWGNPPPNASMVAFGNLGVSGADLQMQGWLFDAKNVSAPQVLGKQYKEPASQQSARDIAHKFAAEIIFRLGGGIAAITDSKIVFISTRTGHKEVWEMDYDGANQHQITHLGSISLSPRISPGGDRIAFTTYAHGSPDIVI